MSTRSALAYIPTKDELTAWKGVYCHWDGYPTNRGREIWEVLHRDFLNNEGEIGVQNDNDPHNAVQAFIDIYIKGHSGGWSSFPKECYCHSPEFVMRDGVRNGEMTSDKADPLYIEWVYILDPNKLTLTILSHKAKEDYPEKTALEMRDSIRMTPELDKDGYIDYGHCAYKHEKVATIDLLGNEPDWKAIESRE